MTSASKPKTTMASEQGLAAAWGIAESTLFFLVPDVLLTRIALASPKRAYLASVLALGGALLGGAVMYLWGGSDPESARATLEIIPGIRADMLTSVSADLSEHGPAALFGGPPRGVPYKIYAVEWGQQDGSLPAFLLYSVPARLLRFLATTALASFLRRTILRRLSLRSSYAVHAAFWFVFYACYFYVMRG